MSDAEDDVSELGRHALRTARVEGLRRRMNEFIQSHDSNGDLKNLRAGVDTMSEIVDDGRDDRI